MPAADTPDYQRGIVNAQKVLATVPPATATATVGVPPNAETVVVIADITGGGASVTVKGHQTGAIYPTVGQVLGAGGKTWQTTYADVASPLDSEVDISWGNAPAGNWYVYSDSGVHLTLDLLADDTLTSNGGGLPGLAHLAALSDGSRGRYLAGDSSGRQYVVPVVPSTAAGQHPTVEVQFTTAGLTASGNVIPAPAAGQRLRLFGVQMAGVATGLLGYVDTVPLVGTLCGCPAPNTVILPAPPQGIALPPATALHYTLGGGSGNMVISAQYTVETV